MNAADSIQNPALFFSQPNSGRATRALAIILVIALLARVYICFFSGLPNLHRDTGEYLGQSDAILAGGYINFFPNGYPFLITMFRSFNGQALITALLWVNILMSVVVTWFVYRIAARLFPATAIALLAALITAVFPSQVNYVRWLSSEVPTAFFLVGAYYYYIYGKNFAAGLFFGLATVVRTEVLPIAILLVLAGLLARRQWKPMLLAGLLLPLILTAGYCYLKTGRFSISGHGEVNIVLSTTASGSYIDWDLADRNPQIRTSGQAIGLYVDTFMAEPGAFLKRRSANAWELWGFYPSSADGSRSMANRLLIGLGNVFLLLFGAYGWWANRRRFEINMLMLPFLVITAVHIVFFAMQRYTYPVEPFMIITATWSLAMLFSTVTRRAGRIPPVT